VASDLDLPHTAEWIEWYDHVGFTEAYWRTEDQAKELTPAVVVSLGFVIEDRPDALLVVPHYGGENMCEGTLLILKANIRLRRPIESLLVS